MKLTHFQLMLLFALLVSAAMGSLEKRKTIERVKAAAWTFVLFIVIGIAIAWLLYPFSH
jgi:predicted PurR-regulated permease PerM